MSLVHIHLQGIWYMESQRYCFIGLITRLAGTSWLSDDVTMMMHVPVMSISHLPACPSIYKRFDVSSRLMVPPSLSEGRNNDYSCSYVTARCHSLCGETKVHQASSKPFATNVLYAGSSIPAWFEPLLIKPSKTNGNFLYLVKEKKPCITIKFPILGNWQFQNTIEFFINGSLPCI